LNREWQHVSEEIGQANVVLLRIVAVPPVRNLLLLVRTDANFTAAGVPDRGHRKEGRGLLQRTRSMEEEAAPMLRGSRLSMPNCGGSHTNLSRTALCPNGSRCTAYRRPWV